VAAGSKAAKEKSSASDVLPVTIDFRIFQQFRKTNALKNSSREQLNTKPAKRSGKHCRQPPARLATIGAVGNFTKNVAAKYLSLSIVIP
jgi:hypothetical protein